MVVIIAAMVIYAVFAYLRRSTESEKRDRFRPSDSEIRRIDEELSRLDKETKPE